MSEKYVVEYVIDYDTEGDFISLLGVFDEIEEAKESVKDLITTEWKPFPFIDEADFTHIYAKGKRKHVEFMVYPISYNLVDLSDVFDEDI